MNGVKTAMLLGLLSGLLLFGGADDRRPIGAGDRPGRWPWS